MLLIAYGNPGRGDDGIGPAFADRLESRQLPGITIDVDYQLTVEHALAVADASCVVFVDAALDIKLPYFFETVGPTEKADISSHSLSPISVLTLSKTLYGNAPEAFVLGISGHVFGDVREGLSEAALCNLDLAETFFLDWLQNRQ